MAALAMAAPAIAQDDGAFASSSPTRDQYGDRADQFADPGGGDPRTSVGSLPFTGLDLALMGGAAATLLAGGVLMRRRLDPGEES